MKKSSNYLDRIPCIPEGLSFSEKDRIITIRRENRGFYNRLAQKVFSRPVYTDVELDEFGSFVFSCIDGKKDITAIGIEVRTHFGNKTEPLYQRLARFLEMLHMNGFVEFRKQG